MNYGARISALLSASERRALVAHSTPQKIQNYLDSLPINFETTGETYMSVRRTLHAKTAHCFEGALFAAAALALQGHAPLLMDLKTSPNDEDHVVALFRRGRYWGAISKTNHPILRWRDAVYLSPRELAMSYFHEYIDKGGRKSMRSYSTPFTLSQFAPERWVTAEDDLFWLVETLDESRHFPVVPKNFDRHLRKGSLTERDAMELVEWHKPPRGKKPRLAKRTLKR